MFRNAVLGAAVAACAAGASAAATVSDVYSSFWVFGDSLSDPGNLFAVTGGSSPTSPPYYQGRFSNGPVWAEGVSAEFAAAGDATANFAFGGARAIANADGIPDFDAQLALFAGSGAPGVLGDRSLASVFFGANDLFGAVGAYAGAADGVAQIAGAALAAAEAVGQGVRTLGALGITDVALWNLPDLGQTPLFNLFAPAGVSDLGTFASATFNARLAQIADDLRAEGLIVHEVDTFGVLAAAIADPAAFGLSETVLPCLFPSAEAAGAFGQPQVCSSADAEARLFFDSVHPNMLGHAALQDAFRAAAPVPLPASALLLAGALAGLAAFRRRSA